MIIGNQPITKRFRSSRWANSSLLCVTVWVGLSTGCETSANLTTGIVVGDSMAPTLVGNHNHAECCDCRFAFRFRELENGRLPTEVVCPNCGWKIKSAEISASISMGEPDHVLIEPDAKIERWDLVAFRLPGTAMEHAAATVGIKRVVGLPGETIEIRGGDLYADGVLLSKDIQTQQATRILIYDSAFRPASNLPNRIRPMLKKSRWHFENDKWLLLAEQPYGANRQQPIECELDWLNYHHWRCCSHFGIREQDFPVEDYYGFNQGLARNLNKTTDLSFEATIKLDDGKFGWRYHNGSKSFTCCLDGRDGSLMINGWQKPWPSMVNSESITIQFFACDGVLRIGPDIYECGFDDGLIDESDGNQDSANSLPLQFGACDGQVEMERIRIWRDIYYFPVSEQSRFLRADIDGYILLGDNVPLSIDSRHWQSVSIDRNEIIGRVKRK